MSNKNNKMEYSKKLLIACGIIFIATLAFCITRDFSSILDATVYGSAITITGGIFGTATVWYMKKSQAEHVAGMQSYMYGDVMNVRYEYNEKMLKLQHQYNVQDYEISNIEMESPIDDMSENALNNMQSTLDNEFNEATSSIESQVF